VTVTRGMGDLRLSVCLSVCVCLCLSVCPPLCVSVCCVSVSGSQFLVSPLLLLLSNTAHNLITVKIDWRMLDISSKKISNGMMSYAIMLIYNVWM
jgi:hypothetical protein